MKQKKIIQPLSLFDFGDKEEPVAKEGDSKINEHVAEDMSEQAGKAKASENNQDGQRSKCIDFELLPYGIEMAAFYIEGGVRKFADYAQCMIDDVGDKVRPYLKAFYEGIRYLPVAQEEGWDKDMTPCEEVRSFDIENFAKIIKTCSQSQMEQKYYVGKRSSEFLSVTNHPGTLTVQDVISNIQRMMEADEEEQGKERTPWRVAHRTATTYYYLNEDRIQEIVEIGEELVEIPKEKAEEYQRLTFSEWELWELPRSEWD